AAGGCQRVTAGQARGPAARLGLRHYLHRVRERYPGVRRLVFADGIRIVSRPAAFARGAAPVAGVPMRRLLPLVDPLRQLADGPVWPARARRELLPDRRAQVVVR